MICETCRQPAATESCALCENVLCEDCVLGPPSGAFSLMPKTPTELTHRVYCRFCYDEKIEPELLKYEETRELAENVFIFFKTQRKEIPLIRKSKVTMKVEDCDDRDETILRLAFMAAEQGFNAVIETDVSHQKIRNHGHQTTRWHGTGLPAMVDEAKLDRQHKLSQVFERG